MPLEEQRDDARPREGGMQGTRHRPAGLAGATGCDTSATAPARTASRGASRRPKKPLTPFANARVAIIAFGNRHPALTGFGSAVAAVGMVLLLVWFLVFSGFDSPPTFIYAGF